MTKHVDLRLSDELLEKVDKRKDQVGISRNEWIIRALRWAVAQPVTTRTVTEQV